MVFFGLLGTFTVILALSIINAKLTVGLILFVIGIIMMLPMLVYANGGHYAER